MLLILMRGKKRKKKKKRNRVEILTFPSRSPRGFSLPFPLSPTRSLHWRRGYLDFIVTSVLTTTSVRWHQQHMVR